MGSKRGRIVVLEALGERVNFEVAVGRNGRVWVGGEGVDVRVVVVVLRVLRETDMGELDEKQQRALVGRVLREFSGS